MGGESDRTRRRIQALYATGPLGALGDAELLGRFAAGEGLDREDAFAALVRRHGPMVLSACRRMLGGDRAGADDAFQAVFLVLARKAGSLRRPDDLRPWLYGVAVRAGKEARRRAARLHAREGGTLGDLPAPHGDASLCDLRAALDEELERLPGRYREPILLCELEGASRRDAAERLGLAEGTLSSRLARGRSLLRERLARRGLAVGALGVALAPTAKASGLEALADASVRLVLASPSLHGPPGTASAAVAVAEGVLAMLSAAKLKALAAASAATLGLLVLTAGLAWGLSGSASEAEPPAAVVEQPASASAPRPFRLRGVVVDEDARPVAGADVRLNAYGSAEVRSTTGPDGSYMMEATPWQANGRSILARSADGLELGVFRHEDDLIRPTAEKPARLVLKPAREIAVRVADGRGSPVVGAEVEAVGDHDVVAHAVTEADGQARLPIPRDGRILVIQARKRGTGFGFSEFIEVRTDAVRGVTAAALPATVGLILEESDPVIIRAVDEHDRPLDGVSIAAAFMANHHLSLMLPAGRSRLGLETTGEDGVVVFEWLPKSRALKTFRPKEGQGYAQRRIEVEPNQEKPVVARLERAVPIRGRVALPDGSPAKGKRVVAMGSGRGMDIGGNTAWTDDDGTYAMDVPPGEAYIVWVWDANHDAEPKIGLIARPGARIVGIDFRLMEGTVLHGNLTVGPENRPMAGATVQIIQEFGLPPAEVRTGVMNWYIDRALSRHVNAQTDGRGRYMAHLVPGTYKVRAPGEKDFREVVARDQAEVALDFHLERMLVGRLSGRVVEPQGKPAADARVEIAAVDGGVRAFETRADAEGRYTTNRRLVPTSVCALSADGSLGAAVEIGPDAAEADVTLSPTASASGRIVDGVGQPLNGDKVQWARRSPEVPGLYGAYWNDPGNELLADAEGRFTLPALVVGQEYTILVKRGSSAPWATRVKPGKPGPLDLGTLQVVFEIPANPTLSFRDDAPDVGAVAPAIVATGFDGKPLSLGDFAGKFVLLDFGATWSQPWQDEDLPALRTTYDAYAKDDRLAIISLLDFDSSEALRAFQRGHKLPWTVGRLEGNLAAGPNAAYGVRALPATFLIGPDGKIRARGMWGGEIRETVMQTIGAKH